MPGAVMIWLKDAPFICQSQRWELSEDRPVSAMRTGVALVSSSVCGTE